MLFGGEMISISEKSSQCSATDITYETLGLGESS